MPRTCTVCASADREQINAALISAEPIRTVANRFRLTPSALQRHKATHLPAALVKAAEIAEVVEAGTLLDRLKTLNRETAAVLQEARSTETKDNDLALKAIARVEKQIELEGRLLGELQEGATVNVILSPEWQRLRVAILAALEPFPTAKQAVVVAVTNAGA